MDYSLSLATPADRDWVWLVKKTTLHDYVEATYGEWDEDLQHSHFLRNFVPEEVQIVTVGTENVGFIQVEHTATEIYLCNIGFLPVWQGYGLGSALIRSLLAEGKARGIPVRLQVLQSNPARRLYERLGFKLYGENPTHFLLRWKPEGR